MKRDPTVHIRKTHLKKVLVSVLGEASDATVEKIFKAAQQYQQTTRYLVQGNAAMRKKVAKAIESENPIVEKFNRILVSIRMEQNHKYVQHIRKNDKSYLLLKEVAQLAYDFGELYSIAPREEAYKVFARIGIKLMSKRYGLGKFKYYKDKIHEIYECNLIVMNDPSKESTSLFLQVWMELMLEYTGVDINVKDNPMKFVHIVNGREDADAYEANYEDWIRSQFEGLAFLDVVPELSQMYGDNAGLRYEKYMVKKNRIVKDKDDSIPDGGGDSEQSRYWDAIKRRRNDGH